MEWKVFPLRLESIITAATLWCGFCKSRHKKSPSCITADIQRGKNILVCGLCRVIGWRCCLTFCSVFTDAELLWGWKSWANNLPLTLAAGSYTRRRGGFLFWFSQCACSAHWMNLWICSSQALGLFHSRHPPKKGICMWVFGGPAASDSNVKTDKR